LFAIFLAFTASAFPLQGSIWRSVDSAFVIDGDSIVLAYRQCLCSCPSDGWVLTPPRDTSHKVLLFPGIIPLDTWFDEIIRLQSESIPYDPSKMPPYVLCKTIVVIEPDSLRKYILRTKAKSWLFSADSVAQRNKSTYSITDLHSYSILWRWSSFVPSSARRTLESETPIRLQGWGYEAATGRRIRLMRPKAAGKHLVLDPSGWRLVIVK